MKIQTLLIAGALLMAPAALVAAQPVGDAEIAAIVVTANQVDIDAGELAAATTANAEVRRFAELMVTDHTAVNQAAVELVTRLGVTPQGSATSASLQTAGDENLARLRQLEGAAFDAAYVAHEVAYHQLVIDALDETLIPSAGNEELEALLVKVRPAFEAHLEHARHLQATLENG